MFGLSALMGSMQEPKTLEEYLDRVPLYYKLFETEEDVTIKWYVQDARAGYMVFKDEHTEDTKTVPKFIQWFKDKGEAIEFCVDLARKEIEELKSVSAKS